MKRCEVMNRLQAHRSQLAALGVKSLALFGSVAREEAKEVSDVDFLVEFDRPIGLFHLFAVQEFLEEILGEVKVDLILKRALREEFRDEVLQEAIHAF